MTAATRYGVLLVIALFATAAIVLDAVAPSSAPAAAPSPVPLPQPTSGSSYCPAVAAEDEAVRLTLTVPTADADTDTSAVRVLAGDELVEEVTVSADEPTVVDLEPGRSGTGLTVRWEGAPVVVASRTVGGASALAHTCAASTAGRWYLAGFDSTLGNQAVLHLYNPFSVDAVASVRFATPDGAVDLVTTQDLAVEAGQTVAVDLDEVQPEVRDLGVIVEVVTGRLVAVGEMRFAPPDEDTPGLTGRTVVPAVAEPSGEQLFPYGAAAPPADEEGEDAGPVPPASTWLTLLNPDPDREALVLVTVSAPDPAAEVQGEIPVPPGGTTRVDLSGLSERRTFATTVTAVNDVDVVATRTASRAAGDETAVDVAGPVRPDTQWVVVGPGTEDREAQIDVYNTGSQAVAVTLEPVGLERPSGWTAVEIEPNEQRGFPLAELGVAVAEVPVRVQATGPVAVGGRWAAAGGAPQGFATIAGVPAPVWQGIRERPSTTYDPALGRQPLPPTEEPAAGDDGSATANGA